MYWPQPAYQKGVVPKSMGTTRSAPDIAADADPFTGLNVGMLSFSGKTPTFFEESIGGTSESSPLVAGMVTAAQQGEKVPFGFINPVDLQVERDQRFLRHPSVDRTQPGSVPRGRVRPARIRQHLPRTADEPHSKPNHIRRSELQHEGLHGAGHRARVRQHDWSRNARRAQLHN